MAKDPNKMNIKDKVKKLTPDNDWLRNTAKSFGFASLEVVKELLPNTYSTVDWNKDILNVQDLITDIRDNNGVRKMFTRQLNTLPHIKMAHEALENAKSDLKSGNLYNANRALGLDDNGDFNFDDFSFDTGGFEIIDEDDDGTIDSVEGDLEEQQATPLNVIETMPLAKAINTSSQATVDAINALGDQTLAIESEKIMLDKQSFSASMNAFNSINENLALLVQFNSDSTTKYHAAAIEYFEHMTKSYSQDKEEDNREKIKNKLLNPFTAEGGLKIDEYSEIVKKNLVDIKDNNIVLSGIYDILSNPQLLEGIVKNPIGFLMQEGIKKALSNQFKNALSGIDKNLNSVLPAILARINTFEDNNDPFLKKLYEIFGYKHKLDKDVDLGDYEKGAISWDGISRKTLVDVIPTYLRRIESAITGAGERVFNYSTGKFTDVSSIEEYYDKQKSDVEISGFHNVKSNINDVINKLDLSTDAKEQVKLDFDAYFRKMTNEGHLIRHNKRTNEFGNETSELYESGIGGYDLDRVNLMSRIIDMLPRHIQTEMGTTAITDSRERTHKFYQEIKDDPTLYGYSILHNNSLDPEKVKYNKEDSFGIGRKKDRYGLSELDYLRDIRTALINGIKVFPDNRKRYKGDQNPNAQLLSKQINEETEYKNKVAAEELRKKEEIEQKNSWKRSGRSIQEAANMYDSTWNNIFPQENTFDVDGKGEITKKVDSLNEKLQDMIYQILYGEDDYKEKAIEKLKGAYSKSQPIMKSLKDFYGDTVKAFKCFFTGQGYVTSDGIKVEAEQGLLGSIKDSITGIKEKVKGSFKPGGLFDHFFSDVADGFNDFKISLFGEKGVSEGKETMSQLMGKLKQRLPKALGTGVATGLIKTVFASNLGILGSFLLPGGPLGAVLTGTTFSLLKQSETFNRYMFGEKDEDGNRVGGLISKAWQDKYQEYKGVIGKGAGIGLLASFFLPGGPVTGAIMGIGAGITSKNEAFQELLYGKDFREKDTKSLANGVFGKIFKRMSKEGDGIDNPKLAKFLGATGLGVGIAQGVGLLPSFLLPGGPIMGAMLGLAAGITASSNKFQEWLLGEKDIDGQRYGGLLHRAANWVNITFAQPLKLKAVEFNDFLYGMFKKHIFNPIARSIEPITQAFKNVFINVKDSIVNMFTNIANPIVEFFKDEIIKPVGKFVKTLLSPLKWVLKKTMGFLASATVGLATMPLKFLGWGADKFNAYSAVRQEKYRRYREYDATTPKEERNYYDRKKAGKISRKDKKDIINEKLQYREGKTWRQRKKEQNKELKDEMLQRKQRREEMRKQFEEDKQFAKDNKYKFSSKKQKEKREAELKAKEMWYQEQQLMKAQDTDEKVSKISDNIVKISDYQKDSGSKLDDIKNTVKEGFNKLAGKFSKGTPTNNDNKMSSNEEDHMTKIYDFLDEKEKREGLKPSEKIEPVKDYGKVTDEHLKPIHDFLDKEQEKDDQKPTLKGAFDDLKGSFKELFKNIKDHETIDTSYVEKSKPSKEKPVKWSPLKTNEPSKIPTKLIDNEKESGKEKPVKWSPLKTNEPSKIPTKLIDMDAMRKKLRKDDQSHAEGLEKVPEDGYIAELHKDEMVVPKKPAGKLRNMMGGLGNAIGGLSNLFSSVVSAVSEDDRRDREDNALGLSDVEEDRLQEIEDRKRRDKIVNKKPNIIKNAGRFIGDVFNETTEDDINYNGEQPENVEQDLSGGLGFLGKGLGAVGNLLGFGGISKREQEDDALGLNDQQEDMLKEIEDRERKEKVSRKNVDFIQEKIAADAKEKADRRWKESLLNAIRHVGNFAASTASGTMNLFDLIGKGVDKLGGLFDWLKSPLGLAAIVAGISWLGDKYQESEEYIQAHTDKDGNQITDNYDLVKTRTWISARDQLITKPAKFIKKKVIDPVVDAGKTVYKGGKKIYETGKEKLFGKKAADAAVDSTDNVIDFTAKKAAKEGAEEVVETGAKKVVKEGAENVIKEGAESTLKNTGKVINLKDAKIAKGITDTGSGKTLAKAADVADDSGLIGKLVKWGKESVKILGDKIAEKFPKSKGLAKKLLSLSDEIFGSLLKSADNIIAKFSKKITAVFTKIGAGASTAFLLDAGLAVLDLATGFTAGNAGNLFGVSPDNVDFTMRTISSVIQAVFNFNFMAIISLINEITNMIFNFNFLRSIAIWAYNFFGGDQNLSSRISAAQIDKCTSIEEALSIMGITNPTEISLLKDKNGNWKNFSEVDNKELGGVISPTEQMELARLQYNLKYGTKVSSQAFIDQESKTVGTKFIDWITPDTANEKYTEHKNKATDKREKAKQQEEEAKNSKTWLGKTWNKGQAWLYNKSAEKHEKKAEKVKEKAAKKKTKAEGKVTYHEQKAQESTGLKKKYHEWRAKKNKKKVEKYTIKEDQVVVAEDGNQNVTPTTSQESMEAQANILNPDRVKMMYPKMKEGDVIQDKYGNQYDHNGNCIYSPSMEISDDAGAGDGAVMADEYGNQYDADGNLIEPAGTDSGLGKTKSVKKKRSLLSKIYDPLGVKKKVNDKVVEGLKKGKDKTVEWFNKGKEQTKKNFKAIGKEIKEFSSNPLAYTLNTTAEVTDKVYNKSKEIVGKGKELLTNTKDKIVDGIKNNKTVQKVTNAVKEKANKVKEKLTAGINEDDSAGTKAGKIVRNVIKEVTGTIEKITTNVKNSVKEVITKIGDSFKKLITEIPKKIGEIKDSIVNGVKEGIDKIKKGFKTLITETPKKIGEFKDNIISGFKNGLEKVKTGFKNTMTNLKEGIGNKVDDVKKTFSKENIKEKLTKKTDEVKKAWGNFTDTFSKIFEDFKKKFEDWKSKFSNFKLPSLKFSDVKIGWGKVVSFFKDFVAAIIAKDPEKIKDEEETVSSGPAIPLNKQIKPKNYVFSEQDSSYNANDKGATVGGLKDKGNTHNFPYYAQSDNRWGKERLMGSKTLGEAGCGPTATAMVLTHLTGQHITPDTTAKASNPENLPGATTYNFFPEIAQKFKLNYSEVNDVRSIRSKLATGQPVLLAGTDKASNNITPYTTEGHIVVATGIEGNNIQINDPRGPGYSGSYSLSNVMKGLKRGIVLSSTNDTESVGLPSSGVFNTETQMTGKYETSEDLPTNDDMEKLGGDAGQIKLWEKVIGYAKAFKEKLRYVYGSKAIDNNGMTTDCSGFTKHVMDRCGVKIPAGSAYQKDAGVGVDKSQAQAGDLVVWKGHVGLVVDSNKNMIDAGSGSVPKIRSYETDYWRSRGDYVIRRVLSNPNEMVSAKVDNYHTGIGFNGIADPQGGQDLAGGWSTNGSTSGESVESTDTLGIFAKMSSIGDKLLSSIYNGRNMFIEPTTDGTYDGTTVDISGISDVATAVWKFFTGKGYSNHATAGIMGNLQQESGMDPTRKQSGGGPGRGIAQWTVSEGRFKGLQSHAQSKGKDWTDLQSQLEWIDLELNGKDPTTANKLKNNFGGISGLKSATNTRWAVEAFEKSFERAGKPNYANRYKYAESFYNQLSNAGMGPAMATSVQTAPTDGTIPSSMNGWKYYQQSDSKWSGQVGNSTVSKGGCGPTSAAMMLSTIFGKEINPLTMTKWAHSNGTWTGAMQWSMPQQVAKTFGLQMTELGAAQNGVDEKVLGYVKESIKAGKPVMLTGKGKGASGSAASMETPFTPGGHVVLAVGMDGSGNLIINDPRGAHRSKAYTDEGILNIGPGLRGAWAFDTNGGSIPSDISTDGDFTGGTGMTTGSEGSVESTDTLGIFAKMSSIGDKLLSSIYNEKNMFSNAGLGDGKTYMVNPIKNFKPETIEKRPNGDAGKGDKVTYNKSITNNTTNNTTDVNAQRNLDDLNRRVNAAMSGMNSADPAVYTEVLKLIMEELQAINKNTAATATNVKNIEIVSSNTPVSGTQTQEGTTKERYLTSQQKRMPDRLQTINQSTGYNVARDIAGYKKKK